MKNTCTLLSLFLLLASDGASAFTVGKPPSRPQTALQAESRRAFLDVAFATAGASLIAGASPAFADGVGDLSMPTEEEQKTEEQKAMEERLRRKAELQKKTAQPRNFRESLKGELDKQSDFKKQTKEERRNALCEELGRGC